MSSRPLQNTPSGWKETYRAATRELARHLVSSLYPQEAPVFDLLANAYLELDVPLPIGDATERKVAGLPFGDIAHLGTLKAMAFVGLTMLSIAELGSLESLQPAEAHQRFVNRRDLQEACIRKAQLPPSDGLGLDVRTAEEFMKLTLDFIGAPKFVLGQPAPLGETRRCEFKSIATLNVVDAIADTAERYVVGFLNSGGGSIYWGIEPDRWLVEGVRLDTKKADELQQKVIQRLAGIRPAVDPTTAYRLRFHPVFKDDQIAVGLCVVELSVLIDVAANLYRSRKGKPYARLDGLVRELSEAEASEYLRSRRSFQES